jgi:preprotein translocase subunit SecB
MAEEQAATQQDQPQQQFAMQRIYSKDISFESPSTPGVFTKQWQPKVNVDLNTKSDKIDEKGRGDRLPGGNPAGRHLLHHWLRG